MRNNAPFVLELYNRHRTLRVKEKWLTVALACSLLTAVGIGAYIYGVWILNQMPPC